MTGNTINSTNYDGQGKTHEEEADGSMVVVAVLMLIVAGVFIGAVGFAAWAILT